LTDAMLASVVGGLSINLVAPRGPYPHPRCRDAGQRCLVVAVQPEDGRGEQAGPRRGGRGDARDHAPDEGARAHADRERGQCLGCEVGAAQAGYLRGQRAALAELKHRLVVPENMTLTRAAPGGHGPGEKREPGTLFALCDYLMSFDLF
jgi:hypothetical protein